MDLGLLDGAIKITNMETDLKNDRLLYNRSPVILEVAKLNNPHVEDNSNEPFHLLNRHRFPILVEGVGGECHG